MRSRDDEEKLWRITGQADLCIEPASIFLHYRNTPAH
jgi:hypothetical protein